MQFANCLNQIKKLRSEYKFPNEFNLLEEMNNLRNGIPIYQKIKIPPHKATFCGKKFDHNDFYCQNNSTIIEELLESESFLLNQIINTFLDANQAKNALTYFRWLFQRWKMEDSSKLEYISVDPSELGSAEMKINPERALVILVEGRFITNNICRLPRKINSKMSHSIDSYYGEHDWNEPAEKLILADINYTTKRPPFITGFLKAKSFIEEKGLDEDVLKQAILNNLVGVYLDIQETDISTHSDNKLSSRISYFRDGNNGNPNYKIRYKDIERLTTGKDSLVNELLCNKNNSVEINKELRNGIPVLFEFLI